MRRFLDSIFRGQARLAACLLAMAPLGALAYNLGGERWGGTTVPMHLQFGPLNGALLDGSTSWGSAAESALAIWNANLTNIQFTVVRDSTAPVNRGNSINNVFWSSTIYGMAWDSRTLGITLSTFSPDTHRYSETDVLFNSNLAWNSYRGALRSNGSGGTLYDFRRVALHEFGHALGLDHPDDIGQSVAAIMNSATSDTDTLTADDIAGVRAIYDAPGSLASAPTIGGGAGYSFLGASLTLNAGRVANEGNLASDNLRLELWAMPTPYANGLPAGSRLLGAYAFDPLPVGFAFNNVDVTTFYTPPPAGTYFTVLLLTEFTGGSGSGFTIRDKLEFSGTTVIASGALPTVTSQPASVSVAAGSGATATFTMTSSVGPPYQWQHNGVTISGATGASLMLANVQSASTGVYQGLMTNLTGVSATNFALLGLTTSLKVVGNGSEIASNIVHPVTHFTYDQILLDGTAATFTADRDPVDPTQNQITRLSYIDLSDDIVQIEFSGAGSVSIVLDNPTGPAAPANYNQSTFYMKGRAGIVVSGANETTNLSVFSVGRGNAVNQALFKDNVSYDGRADIAFIAIASPTGKFGGLRTANAVYSNSRGLVGVYAPNVEFTGPVFVGDINASQSATPALVLGAGSDVRVTGGDMLQTNARPVQVAGITQLKFGAGSTSHYTADMPTTSPQWLPAKTNKGRFEQNGLDITTQIVVQSP